MDEDIPERVLFMFEPESIIRRFFIWIGNQFLFDAIVFAAIIASCVFLMITPPYEDMIDYSHDVNTNTVKPPITLETMDMWNSVITIIFTIELMIRCMSQVINCLSPDVTIMCISSLKIVTIMCISSFKIVAIMCISSFKFAARLRHCPQLWIPRHLVLWRTH